MTIRKLLEEIFLNADDLMIRQEGYNVCSLLEMITTVENDRFVVEAEWDKATIMLNAGDFYEDIVNKNHAEKLSKKIVECINDNDVNGMKKLFSEYYQGKFNLEKEIQHFFDSIDGKILSYEFKYYGEDGSVRDGEWTKQSSITKLENVKTDLGKEYSISIREYLKYEDDKSKEGVYDLEVRNADRKEIAAIYYD